MTKSGIMSKDTVQRSAALVWRALALIFPILQDLP